MRSDKGLFSQLVQKKNEHSMQNKGDPCIRIVMTIISEKL